MYAAVLWHTADITESGSASREAAPLVRPTAAAASVGLSKGLFAFPGDSVEKGASALSTPTITPALLRESEAREYIGVSRSKLWSLIWSGEIKRVHVGRAMRIPRAQLDAYVQARCAAAGIEGDGETDAA